MLTYSKVEGNSNTLIKLYAYVIRVDYRTSKLFHK